MSILIAVETMALILMAVLVGGLLRSHAEILRRLAASEMAPQQATGPTLPFGREHPGHAAPDLVGTTIRGDALKFAVTGMRENTLLAFLSSGCISCIPLWRALSSPTPPPLPARTRLLVVTKDRTHESPSKLRDLAPTHAPVVMSTAAWEAYGVQGSPYFIYVDGQSGQVHGEGTATAWEQVLSLLNDALLDTTGGREADGSAQRIRRADAELAAAGILPGHPSLWGEQAEREDGDG